jgi:hypothetical protein
MSKTGPMFANCLMCNFTTCNGTCDAAEADRLMAANRQLAPYPQQICHACATNAGGNPRGNLVTMNLTTCDVCGKETGCCAPRDYRYPEFEGFEKP